MFSLGHQRASAGGGVSGYPIVWLSARGKRMHAASKNPIASLTKPIVHGSGTVGALID
jgi:hypothetical protein